MAEVLTKERPQSSNLIMDGPNEIIHKALVKFQEVNANAAITAVAAAQAEKEEAIKKALKLEKLAYATVFVENCETLLGINQNQCSDLVSKIKDTDIVLIENGFLRKIKRRAVLSLAIGTSIAAGSFFSMISLLFINVHDLAPFVALGFIFFVVSMITMAASVIGFADKNSPCGSLNYICARRRLKKKYGPDYFPVKELKEKLGLVSKQLTEGEK